MDSTGAGGPRTRFVADSDQNSTRNGQVASWLDRARRDAFHTAKKSWGRYVTFGVRTDFNPCRAISDQNMGRTPPECVANESTDHDASLGNLSEICKIFQFGAKIGAWCTRTAFGRKLPT